MNNSLGVHASRQKAGTVGHDITRSLRISGLGPDDIHAARPPYVTIASRRPVEI